MDLTHLFRTLVMGGSILCGGCSAGSPTLQPVQPSPTHSADRNLVAGKAAATLKPNTRVEPAGQVEPETAKTKQSIHPAVQVAEAILQAIISDDAQALRSHLNKVNRRKLPMARIARAMAQMRRRVGSHNRVLEVRTAPKYVGAKGVAVKFAQRQTDVLVLMLSFEDGAYRFEDINSPSLQRYQEKALLWSR